MGIFHPYIGHGDVRLIGVEAAGSGIETGQHAASLSAGRPGVLHGNRTYLLQDEDGQIIETHSISAGLDYPGVGPEHAWLKDIQRAEYVGITDAEALQAFHNLCRFEGHHSGAGVVPCAGLCRQARPDPPEGQGPAGEFVRSRRQGHAYRCREVRHPILIFVALAGTSGQGH
jgi:hypothetical protein